MNPTRVCGLWMLPFGVLSVMGFVLGTVTGCVTPSVSSQRNANTENGPIGNGPGSPLQEGQGSPTVVEREPLDSKAEAEWAQVEARKAMSEKFIKVTKDKAESTRGQEPTDFRTQEPRELLRQLIINGEIGAAARMLSELRSLRNPSPMAALVLALADFHRGQTVVARQRLKEVRKEFERARAQLAPDELVEIEYLSEVVAGVFELSLGQETEGLRFLARASEIASQREEHYLVLAAYQRSRGRFSLALRVIRELFAVVDGPSVDAFLAKADIEGAAGLESDKSATLRRALSLFPASGRLESYLAREEFWAGEEIAACDKFATIYRSSSSDADAAYNHGFCLKRLGSSSEAIRVLEGAVSLNSTRSDLKTLLATLYLEQGRQPDADRLWREFPGGPADAGSVESANRFLMQSMDAPRSEPQNLQPSVQPSLSEDALP